MNSNKLSTFTFTLRVLALRMCLVVVALLLVAEMALQTTTAQAAEGGRATNNNVTLTGKVTAKGNDNFSLAVPDKNVPILVKVLATTKFVKNGQPVSFADLQVGMMVAAYLHYSPVNSAPNASRWEALQVFFIPPVIRTETISGTVRGKNSEYVSLTLGDGSVRYLKITSVTTFVRNGQPATLADLPVGVLVQAVIKISSQSEIIEASQISWQVNVPSQIWYGIVHAKGADYFYLKLTDGTYRRLKVTPNTVFVKNGQNTNFAALAIGDQAEVQAKLDAGSTTMGEALKVSFKTP